MILMNITQILNYDNRHDKCLIKTRNNMATLSIPRRFTPKENDIIISCVENSPNNLQHSFEIAAKLLIGRTSKSVRRHYYNVLRHTTNIMILSTVKGAMVNVKNSPRKFNRTHMENEKAITDVITKLNPRQIIWITKQLSYIGDKQ